MLGKTNVVRISTAFLMLTLSAAPSLSYADWGVGNSFGFHTHFLPVGYRGGDYVIVNPPIGAYVSVIPPDCHSVIINGRTYYTEDGIYYVLTRYHGYKVVTAPTVYAQPAPVVVTQPVTTVVTLQAPVVTQGSFTVNIPNNSGGYTTVVISRSGNGFVGPQGEFYPEFPEGWTSTNN